MAGDNRIAQKEARDIAQGTVLRVTLKYKKDASGHPFLRIRVALFRQVNYTVIGKNEREAFAI